MLPYFDQRSRITLFNKPFSSLTKQRSDGRIMLSDSCLDIRAWSSFPSEYTKYFQQQVEENYNLGRIIPQSAIIDSIKSFRQKSLDTTYDFGDYKSFSFSSEQKSMSDKMRKSKSEYSVDEFSKIEYIEKSTSPFSFANESNLDFDRTESNKSIVQQDAAIQVSLGMEVESELDLITECQSFKQDCQDDRHSKSSCTRLECESMSDSDSHSYSCSELEYYKKEYGLLKEKFIQQESTILAYNCELDVKNKDIEELKMKNEELQCIMEELEYKKNSLQSQIQKMNDVHLKEIRNLKDDFQDKISNLEDRHKHSKNEMDKLYRQVDSLESENNEMQAIFAKKINELQCKVNELHKKNAETAKILKERNDECEKTLNTLSQKEKEVRKLKEELKSALIKLQKVKKKKHYILNPITNDDNSALLPAMYLSEFATKSYSSVDDSSEDEDYQQSKHLRHHKQEKHPKVNQDITGDDGHSLVGIVENFNDGNINYEILEINDDQLECIKANTQISNVSFGDHNLNERKTVIGHVGQLRNKQIMTFLSSQIHHLFDGRLSTNIQQESEQTHKLMSMLEKYKNENKDLQQNCRESIQEVRSLQEQLNRFIVEVETKSEEIVRFRRESEKKSEEIEKLTKQLESFAMKDDMTESCNKLREESCKLKEELLQVTSFLKEQQKEQQIFEESFHARESKLESEIDELKTNLSRMSVEKEQLESSLNSTLSESKAKDSQIQQMSKKLKQLAEISSKVEKYGEKMDLLVEENRSLQQENQRKLKMLQECKEKITALTEIKSVKEKSDEATIINLKSTAESQNSKIKELEELVSTLSGLNEELKTEKNATNHLLSIYQEIAKVDEQKWNLEETLKSLKAHLTKDQNENRKLESELNQVERANESIKREIKNLKERIVQLRDLLLKKSNDETPFNDVFDRLSNQITILRKRCYLNDAECDEFREKMKEKLLVNQVEKINVEIQFDSILSQKMKSDEQIKILNEELQIKESRYNERLKSMHNQYLNQMTEIRKHHNIAIETLMKKYEEHQTNPRLLLENNEWFKDVATHDLKTLYKRLKKHLRSEMESDTEESMKCSDKSGSDLENIIQKLQLELQNKVRENEVLNNKLVHEEKINDHLMEKMHGKKQRALHKLDKKHSRTSIKSCGSSVKSNYSSEYSESDRSHCNSKLNSYRSASSATRKNYNKLSTGSAINRINNTESFVRMASSKLQELDTNH